jgi:gamma-glutamylaminecyclotransferase
MTMAATLLFVYGTLMRDEANAPFLEGCRFLGPVLTEPAFTLFDLGDCPAMLPGGATAVAGELYEVDAETMADLDAFEGTPYQYLRRAIRLADGRVVEAFLLPVPATDAPVIAGGDWRRRGPAS